MTRAEAVELMKTDFSNTSIVELLHMNDFDNRTLTVTKRLISMLLETTQSQLKNTIEKLRIRLSIQEIDGKEDAGLEVVQYLITLFECHHKLIDESLKKFTALLDAAGSSEDKDSTTVEKKEEKTLSELEVLTTGLGEHFKCKASSVLNGSAEYQVKNIFIDDDSCWNSEGNGNGTSQFLFFDFLNTSVKVHVVKVMFQGGFVGQEASLYIGKNKANMSKVHTLDEIAIINDSNDLQEWIIPTHIITAGQCFKIEFGSSTDFYGRVTIYRLELLGEKL